MVSNIISGFIFMVVAILLINVMIWVRYQLFHEEYTKYDQKVWLIFTTVIMAIMFIFCAIQ